MRIVLLVAWVVLCNGQFDARDGISSIRDEILGSFSKQHSYAKEEESLEDAIVRAIEEAKKEFSLLEGFSYKQRTEIQEPVGLYSKMMEAKKEAEAINKRANILFEATRILVDKFGPEVIEKLENFDVSRILPEQVEDCIREEQACDPDYPYRSHSGWCNNLHFKHLGNAFSELRRLIPAHYNNDLSSPRFRSVLGHPLPKPRDISNIVHHEVPIATEKYTMLVMQFGQFLDHEITLSPIEADERGQQLNCSRCDSARTESPACVPIEIPPNDPHFGPSDAPRCLPFVRSLQGQRSLGRRNQINQITAFIDGSVIYGSTKCAGDALREFKGGLLKYRRAGPGLGVFPPKSSDSEDCRSARTAPCFQAGDERNSQQPGLASLHVLFLRYHNRMAYELKQINGHWDDERLYQEARRIVSGQFTHIVYSQLLPVILGSSAMLHHRLNPESHGYFEGYDTHCDASISQPFATAAYRFGHSLVRRFYARLGSHYQNVSRPVDLVNNFNNLEAVYDAENGGVDSILTGLIGINAMNFDSHVDASVRNELFARRGERRSGLDLISINIQRGRDHGIASYNEHRVYCGLSRADSFESLFSEMDMATVDRLKEVYAHVDDIDLFTGIVSEKPVHDAIVGPTAICILAEQFARLKKCDRFYYENKGPQAFSHDKLDSIRSTTFSGILCSVTRIPAAQSNPFLLPDHFMNSVQDCSEHPRVNLELWREH